MIYILDYGNVVRLGGQVANAQMLLEGWVPYYGPIPEGQTFKLEAGVLVCIDEPTEEKEQD